MTQHNPTPRLTNHARNRCAEMGLSTKVAKAIVQNPTITRPSRNAKGESATIATSKHVPEYAVVYVMDGDTPIILTVVFATTANYTRQGETFKPKP
jgi:hypothetical protein